MPRPVAFFVPLGFLKNSSSCLENGRFCFTSALVLSGRFGFVAIRHYNIFGGSERPHDKARSGRYCVSNALGCALLIQALMRHTFFCLALLLGAITLLAQTSKERPAGLQDGAATILHRADVIKTNTPNNGPMRLWPLHATPDSRMNYVEVSGRSGLHFHPDADHKLYVLEGRLLVTTGATKSVATAGDLIIIPKGVPHNYDVVTNGERALLLTFDAPPYDPKKTVSLPSN